MNNTVYDDVNQSDKEDENDDDVVEDIRRSLARLLVDVHPSDYEEEDADNQLRIEFQSQFQGSVMLTLSSFSSVKYEAQMYKCVPRMICLSCP